MTLGVEIKVSKEWGLLCRCKDVIVVSKLCQWEEGDPVILEKIIVTPEILFQDLIHSLCLLIDLGVVRGREASLYGEEPHKLLPKPDCKLLPPPLPSVSNDAVWERLWHQKMRCRKSGSLWAIS